MQDGACRGGPTEQVVDVEQRIERRADGLDCAVCKAVIEAVPATMDTIRQHLEGEQRAWISEG